jgi:hypothetical protein
MVVVELTYSYKLFRECQDRLLHFDSLLVRVTSQGGIFGSRINLLDCWNYNPDLPNGFGGNGESETPLFVLTSHCLDDLQIYSLRGAGTAIRNQANQRTMIVNKFLVQLKRHH